MGPKQDSRHHCKLQHCDGCNTEDRVVERADHACTRLATSGRLGIMAETSSATGTLGDACASRVAVEEIIKFCDISRGYRAIGGPPNWRATS
jgi:hypothetical protein